MKKEPKQKLTVIEGSLTTEQLLKMLQETPQKHKYKRPAKGGGQWDYVTGTYIKKTLNYVFAWMWSSTILDIREKHGQVCATVRLTILKPDGSELLHKDDVGKKDIIFKKGTNDPLDYGNDEKAAVTDGLKRCAAQLGIASDVYGKEEFKEIEMVEVEEIPESLPRDGEPMTDEQKGVIESLAQKAKKSVEIPSTFGEARKLIAELLRERGTK